MFRVEDFSCVRDFIGRSGREPREHARAADEIVSELRSIR